MSYQYQKPDNLVDWFEESTTKFAKNRLFGTKDQQGNYQWISYGEIAEYVSNCRAGLAQLGVKDGDTVGFISNNRWEWAVAAFATVGLKACFVPMYEAEKPNTWKYIIEHSEISVVIVSTAAIANELGTLTADNKQLRNIIAIESSDNNTSFDGLLSKGKVQPIVSLKPSSGDLATIIYTSGTTGTPKGVQLSHGNVTHDARAGNSIYQDFFCNQPVSISILPWAHSYGMVGELFNWLLTGGSIGFMQSIDTLAEDFMKIQPTFLAAVPRVFNKIYSGINAKMKETGGSTEKVFNWAVAVAKRKRKLAEAGKSSFVVNMQVKLADKLVFSKIRMKFGGKLQGALTASAMMNVEISKFFWDIGIPVFDAYGLTETSPALTMNHTKATRFGSVGKPLHDVRIVIDKTMLDDNSLDGEIIAYGPIVMQGYFKDPEATAATMTTDGGFRTGDRGRLDEDGYLFITGRIKEQYKLENGKYVFPASIEEDLKMLPYIEHAMVYGYGKAYNIAVIVLDFVLLEQWAKVAKLILPPKAIIEDEMVRTLLCKEIKAHLTDKYGGYEIPRKMIFISETFTVSNGLLTQTMKLRRKQVFEKYADQIAKLY